LEEPLGELPEERVELERVELERVELERGVLVGTLNELLLPFAPLDPLDLFLEFQLELPLSLLVFRVERVSVFCDACIQRFLRVPRSGVTTVGCTLLLLSSRSALGRTRTPASS
jgi:hypothetical protein